MGWLIALAAVAGLAVLPLGISARYDAIGARAHLIVGPFRKTLFPKAKKAGNKKKKEKPKKQTAKRSGSGGASKKGGNLSDFYPFLRAILDLITDFGKKLRVNDLELKLILAGDDPCDLAVNYGKAWAALGGLMPQLERFLVIKRRDVGVLCDFVSDKTLIIARMDLTITLGRLFSLGLRRGIHALVEFYKLSNQRKGGVKT